MSQASITGISDNAASAIDSRKNVNVSCFLGIADAATYQGKELIRSLITSDMKLLDCSSPAAESAQAISL